MPTNFRPAPTDQAVFHPLIAALTLPEFRRPLVPQVAVARAILSRDPAAFTRAGCRSHSQYFSAAQAAGLVLLGAGPSNAYEWMTLTPTLQVLVSDFSYVNLGNATDAERIMASGMPVRSSSSKASRLRPPATVKATMHAEHTSSGAPIWPASERLPKAFWRWEKDRRKKAMRAAMAAMARLGNGRGSDGNGAIVSPGLAAVLGARDHLDPAASGGRTEDGPPERLAKQTVPGGPVACRDVTVQTVNVDAAPTQAIPVLPSVQSSVPFRPLPSGLQRSLASFTRNPPLEPLPAELFAPLTAALGRPHLQDAVLLALSRSGEADEAMQRVGAADWREYLALAAVSGVIELGRDGHGRDRWISLSRPVVEVDGSEKSVDKVPP